MALGLSDHDQRPGLHPADADVAVLPVVQSTVGRRRDRALEDSLGGLEPDAVFADVRLILGLVPLEFDRSRIPTYCRYGNSRLAATVSPPVGTFRAERREGGRPRSGVG